MVNRARQLGYDVQGEPLKELFVAFKKLADEKKEIYDDDIVTLIEQQIHGTTEDEWRGENYEFRLNSDGRNLVVLTMAKGGESKVGEYNHSKGPFSAAFAAVQEITGLEIMQVVRIPKRVAGRQGLRNGGNGSGTRRRGFSCPGYCPKQP